ncbi:hypothetical protein [Kutzneria kofuensis]|uniref:Uncharacterized protein n=1 Tax=Kutzneria kofuensis TaxID=103725 RepID=A0A7W9KHH9_9PSEU|nr:hypothetical protein [Kutzneria kofuensis]MBB5892525.1 hypothetical protein [Kutzneria kofuensis]
MDTEDEELLALLRAEVSAQTPPPVHTALDDVVRRGRRRLRTRRIGAALGVVAVVAGVGVATSVLRGALPGGGLPANQLGVASTSSASRTSTLSGWVIPSTRATAADGKDCTSGLSVPGTPQNSPVDLDRVNKTLLASLHEVSPKATMKITRTTNKPTADAVLASTWADVVDSGGGGSVYVEVHGFSGTPAQAADNDQFVGGECTPPRRKSLPDGTVMQLYAPLDYDPGHPSQALRVYTPAHRLYVITAEGFASTDWTQVANAEPGTLAVPEGAGRHSLPLTEDQLATVGERIAALG